MTEPAIKPKPLSANDIKIQDMKDTVDRTKKIMVDNIDQLLQRGEKLEQLVDKSDQTQEQAQIFTQQARQIQIKARFENIAMTAAMLGFVIGGFYGLSSGIGLPMVAICGGIGGVIFYSVVWMFSGAIQSILKLPFLNFGFNPQIEKMTEEPSSLIKAFQPSLEQTKPYLIHSTRGALNGRASDMKQTLAVRSDNTQDHLIDKPQYKLH